MTRLLGTFVSFFMLANIMAQQPKQIFKKLPTSDSLKKYTDSIRSLPPLEVKSIRANEQGPFAKSNISKNQIDDTADRQIDLIKTGFKLNSEIKIQRSKEKKGLLLIYALDERGTPNVKNDIPIIGYSLHFPIIDNEQRVSYTATINNGFDEEIQEDDDLINENE